MNQTSHNSPVRLWTVFFGDSVPTFWSRMLRPGFRHVAAASYFADQERWVYVDPCRSGTVVEVLRPDEFATRFQHLMANSSHVLSFAARRERRRTAAVWFCVGAVKALLGINSQAVTPYGLYGDLLLAGAECVVPSFSEGPTSCNENHIEVESPNRAANEVFHR